MGTRVFTEVLESRVLLSATAASVALNTTVQQDRLQIQIDLLKFKSDALGNFSTLLADLKSIKGDHPADATTLTPLIAQFRSAVGSMRTQLKSDRLAEKQSVLSDESVIVGDLRKILVDHGNSTAETADHAQLLTDRIKLQTDIVAGLNTRVTTRQADYTTIFNDVTAIVTAAQTDPNASPKLVTDLEKFSADKTTALNTITADLQTLIADRTQLITDLTALQTA